MTEPFKEGLLVHSDNCTPKEIRLMEEFVKDLTLSGVVVVEKVDERSSPQCRRLWEAYLNSLRIPKNFPPVLVLGAYLPREDLEKAGVILNDKVRAILLINGCTSHFIPIFAHELAALFIGENFQGIEQEWRCWFWAIKRFEALGWVKEAQIAKQYRKRLKRDKKFYSRILP